MRDIRNEIRDFLTAGAIARANAAQLAAVQCLCGIDLAVMMKADAPTRGAALNRVDRLIERERLKGLAGHWSYDLNRHIALKQAADRLRGVTGAAALVPSPCARSPYAKRRPKAPLAKRDDGPAEAVESA